MWTKNFGHFIASIFLSEKKKRKQNWYDNPFTTVTNLKKQTVSEPEDKTYEVCWDTLVAIIHVLLSPTTRANEQLVLLLYM